MLTSVAVSNLLSFGPNVVHVPLQPLNVLIGPNGSGKSNFLEALAFLHAAPKDLGPALRLGGGVTNWIWKGADATDATVTIEAVLRIPRVNSPMRYVLSFTAINAGLEVQDERLENAEGLGGKKKPYFYFGYENGRPMFNIAGKHRELHREDVNPQQSILSQRKDHEQYPEVTLVGEYFDSFALYRDWCMGSLSTIRRPQHADLLRQTLMEDLQNLGLVVNRIRQEPKLKADFIKYVRLVSPDVVDLEIDIDQGRVQLVLQEHGFAIPASRMSDGTLRWVFLLATLLNPTPPPLVCIEEPELGMHPDLVHGVAELLQGAASRTQVVVTTHSADLVSAFSETPDVVVVCEKEAGATVMRRLNGDDLAVWLKRYSLGDLWRAGEIGGTRW